MKLPAMPATEITCVDGVVSIYQENNYRAETITFPIELWVTIKDMVEESILTSDSND